MFKKYKFPLNLFLIFEKLNPVVYSSECLTSNHYIIFIPKEYYYNVAEVFKNECFFSSSTLVEHSSVDTKHFDTLNESFKIQFNGKRIITFSNFYFYSIKLRVTLLINHHSTDSIYSLEEMYPNSNWIERETSEMFGNSYRFKKDIRNLLLDYSRNEYPLLKEFPSEGYFDIYYDFYDDQLKYIESEFVEL